MRIRSAALVVALVALFPRGAAAQDDVDLIPKEALDTPKASTPRAHESRTLFQGKFFLEDAFSVWSAARQVPVPYSASLIDWQNRSSFDASSKWMPWKGFTIAWSHRLGVFEQSHLAFISANTVRHDFREGYMTWEPAPNTYLEVGRIHVRNGVALGFNPTDFFKARTLLGQASLDPSVIRQNRLGTLMVRGQTIWNGGSASLAFAPKVASPRAIVEDDPVGIDPRFDATNAAYHLLCTVNVDVADLSPQFLAYVERGRSKLGLNLSHPIGDAIVVYAEWAGGPETNVITRAAAFGQSTGTLPKGAPVLPPTDTSRAFRNDAAAGVSWTLATKVTIHAEYHFHQAGLTRSAWRDWFNLGSTRGAPPALADALWFLRAYANDQQEPVSQHQTFVRAA